MRFEAPEIQEANIAEWSESKKVDVPDTPSPGLKTDSDVEMAEIVSPFRQKNYSPKKEETSDMTWRINPVKVQRVKSTEEEIKEHPYAEEHEQEYESSPESSPCESPVKNYGPIDDQEIEISPGKLKSHLSTQ